MFTHFNKLMDFQNAIITKREKRNTKWRERNKTLDSSL